MSKLKEEKRELKLKSYKIFEDQIKTVGELAPAANVKPAEMMRIVIDRGIDSVKEELKSDK